MWGCVGARAGRREGLWDLSPRCWWPLAWRTLSGLRTPAPDNPFFSCRWRLGSIRTYNPEQIMLSAAVRRSSRDVKIMKEKLIFSGMNGAGRSKLFAPSYSCHPTVGGEMVFYMGVISHSWDGTAGPPQLPCIACGTWSWLTHPKMVQA